MVLSYLCMNLHPCMHACTHIKYHTLHNCLFTTVVTQRTMAVNMRNRRQNPSNSFIIHGVVTSLRKPACVHTPSPVFWLCQSWLRHWRGTLYLCAAVQRHGQCPLKGLGTDKTVEATWRPSTQLNVRRIHPRLKKRVPSRFKRFWFCLSWRKQHGQL